VTAPTAQARRDTWASIEDYLGPASARFFGEGYRRTRPRLQDVTVRHPGPTSTLDGWGGIRTTHAWSTKDGKRQRPHLATTDAMAIAAQAIGIVLASRFTPRTAADALVTEVSIRAATTPLEDGLDRFTVSVELGPSRAGGVEHRFTGRVGPFSVTGSITRPLGVESRADIVAPSGIGDTRADGGDVYGARIATRCQRLTHVRLRDGRATALSSVTEPSSPAPAHGLEASAQPAYTPVDVFVATLQLGQLLLYELDGVDRAASDTLWMRRAEVRTAAALSTLVPRPVGTVLERSRIVLRDDAAWRVADVVGQVGPYRVRTGVAHRIGPPGP
jgi:hypothetical protein